MSDESKELTATQREMARHALGLPNRKNLSYRNHYCIGSTAEGYDEWRDLVVKGLAVERTGPMWGGDSMFYLTLEGALLARDPKDHLFPEDVAVMRKL